jgi:hypothetical protein
LISMVYNSRVAGSSGVDFISPCGIMGLILRIKILGVVL